MNGRKGVFDLRAGRGGAGSWQGLGPRLGSNRGLSRVRMGVGFKASS